TFDNAGRKTSVTDALQKTTTTVYDARGNVVKVADPRGNAGYFYYDANNKARFHVDPLGYVTGYVYDALGNVLDETRYANAVAGSYNELTSTSALTAQVTTNAADRKTSKAYDGRGLVTTVTYNGTPTSYT